MVEQNKLRYLLVLGSSLNELLLTEELVAHLAHALEVPEKLLRVRNIKRSIN